MTIAGMEMVVDARVQDGLIIMLPDYDGGKGRVMVSAEMELRLAANRALWLITENDLRKRKAEHDEHCIGCRQHRQREKARWN